jgi:hypothetical protein
MRTRMQGAIGALWWQHPHFSFSRKFTGCSTSATRKQLKPGGMRLRFASWERDAWYIELVEIHRNNHAENDYTWRRSCVFVCARHSHVWEYSITLQFNMIYPWVCQANNVLLGLNICLIHFLFTVLWNKRCLMIFQVSTATNMRMVVFRHVVPCSLSEVYFALIMETVNTYETSVSFYMTTCCNTAGDSFLSRINLFERR